MSMSDTASNIALCNQSLGMLGAKTITVGSTTETNYVLCAEFFDDSRDEMLQDHKWNYAKKRVYAVETTKPIFSNDVSAFTYPSDCLKIWKVAQDARATFEVEGGLILTEDGITPADWVTATDYIAGQYLSSDDSGSDLTYLVDTSFTSSTESTDLSTYCTALASNLKVLEVEYVYQATDVSAYPAYLFMCCMYNLAIKLAPALKQNEEAMINLQALLYGSKRVTGYLDMARSRDAQEQGGEVIKTTDFINSRYSNRW